MAQAWRKFFSLDLEKAFTASFLKLLLVWNPFWTLLVSLVWGEWRLSSILFRWSWCLFEASLVALFVFAMVRLYLLVEGLLAARRPQGPPPHGTGWYLLLMAFLVPPGIFLALHSMVAFINLFFAGDPIPAAFHWQYYGNGIFWSWMLLLVFFLFKSWQDLRDAANLSQLRAEELEKERLQALLAKLKDQLNPHFLFNTLNTVAALIPADPSKAERVVVKLSTLFQGVLAATRKTHQPLSGELDFCRDYLEIEQARFGPRLRAHVEVEEGLESAKWMVPVLLLQPIVENAIKHGLSSRAAGGSLWIRAARRDNHLELSVEDDGVGFGKSTYSGSGTALENCRKRLELSYGTEGRLEITSREGGGTRVQLILPLTQSESLSLGAP
ncbi:MAG TPA: histidine kinase [bacterium]|nr:histidine kinase [bacterium]